MYITQEILKILTLNQGKKINKLKELQFIIVHGNQYQIQGFLEQYKSQLKNTLQLFKF